MLTPPRLPVPYTRAQGCAVRPPRARVARSRAPERARGPRRPAEPRSAAAREAHAGAPRATRCPMHRFCPISAYRRPMPTPYGSRGGMAFGAEELRVLRRALALALHPSPASRARTSRTASGSPSPSTRRSARAAGCGRSSWPTSPATAPRSPARPRAIWSSSRRPWPPGTDPRPDDLAALRALRGNPVAAALLDRCQTARGAGRTRPARAARGRVGRWPSRPPAPGSGRCPAPARRSPRRPAGTRPAAARRRRSSPPSRSPPGRPDPAAARREAGPRPRPDAPQPGPPPVAHARGEVFPPKRNAGRRRPRSPPQQLAAVEPWLLWTPWTTSPRSLPPVVMAVLLHRV